MIKAYFNLNLDNKFIGLKEMSLKRRRSLLRRIYVSDVEIKHTNNKAVITLYVLNTEKNTLYKKYMESKKFFEGFRLNLLKIQKSLFDNSIKLLKDKLIKSLIKYNFMLKKTQAIQFRFELLNKLMKFCNISFNTYLKKNIFNKLKFVRKINIIRTYVYTYKINQLKFEEIYFLYKLNNLLEKVLNKEIEYNIINLKSIVYNTDIFTKALALKLQKRNY
jgi:hypothetical protein